MSDWEYVYSDDGVYWHNQKTGHTTQINAPHPENYPNVYAEKGGYEDMEKWHNLRMDGWISDGHHVESRNRGVVARVAQPLSGQETSLAEPEKSVRVLGAVSPSVLGTVSSALDSVPPMPVSNAASPTASPEATGRTSPTPSTRSRTSTRTRTVVKATAIKVQDRPISPSLLQFSYAGSQIGTQMSSMANLFQQKAPTLPSPPIVTPSKDKDSYIQD
jgi:hypothetical protein